MNSFPARIDIENMGGCLAFSFIPSVHVSLIPDDVDCLISSSVSLVTGKSWLTGVSTHETLQFTEPQEKTAAGPYHKNRITGFYPMQDSASLALFREMRNYKFIVKITDGNGRLRLVGTKIQPLIFKFDADTKPDAKGRAGYAFEFAGVSYNPSPFIAS